MSEFKPNEKVWVEATYEMDSTNNGWAWIFIELDEGNRERVYVPLSSIHCDHTEELERLRAYVELQPCFCQRGRGWINLCEKCRALGKERP